MYPQQQNIKSATTAGLLGIFLGAFGAHNWYLGEKTKGIAHVCMMAGGFVAEIVIGAILPSILSYSAMIAASGFLVFLGGVATLAMSASGIWGVVEGIIILSQGDAGLARKGYAVAAPMPPQQYGPQLMNSYYGQPMNNGGYGAPNNMYPYGQPGNNMQNSVGADGQETPKSEPSSDTRNGNQTK